MTETVQQAAEAPVPDANAIPDNEQADANVQPPGSEADSSPAVNDADDQPPPKGVGKRIDELTRNWRQEQRRNEQLMALLAQREAAPRANTNPPPAPEEGKAKTLADFEYDEAKYQAYLFDQAEKRAVSAAERRLEEQHKRDAAERRKATFLQRESEFAKSVADYHEVTRDPTLPITEAIAEVVSDSDDGPALAYYLAKNRDVTQRISMMSPMSAARELGRIEARLQAEREAAKAAKPVVSKAPPPTPKIEAATEVVEKDPDKMPIDEWKRWREKQLAKRK